MDQQQNSLEFLVVDRVEGGITEDGQAVLMTISTVEQDAIRLCVRAADLERFVTFLLRMAQHGRAAPPSEDRVQYQPIPISGISAGELADGTGCVGVTVGNTELMFQMPISAFTDVARSMLLVALPEQSRVLS